MARAATKRVARGKSARGGGKAAAAKTRRTARATPHDEPTEAAGDGQQQENTVQHTSAALLTQLAACADAAINGEGSTAEHLAQLWVEAKNLELTAIDIRLAAERALCIAFPAPRGQEVGTGNYTAGAYSVRITRALTHNVDTERLQELLEAYTDEETAKVVDRLFRWEARLNKAPWDAEERETHAFFSDCVTSKPAKPSISIKQQQRSE